MIKLTNKAIWSWAFRCWEVLDYWFTLLIVMGLFRISPWVSFDSLCICRNVWISFRLPNLLVYSYSYYSLIIILTSVRLIVMSPFSLVIWVIFFLSYPSYRSSILLIFSKKQLLVFLIFFLLFFILFVSFLSFLFYLFLFSFSSLF